MDDIGRLVWDTRYRLRDGARAEACIEDTWERVSHALADAERRDREAWRRKFYGVLTGFRFLPGGRILAGAGSNQRVTLLNCFAMGRIADSIDGIFEALKEGAITMQAGGGVGYDFSTLRPAGDAASASGAIASGPVSFMHVWDSMCATVLSTGNRRGAMMATLRCDHPDIEAFVDAKRAPGALRRFNLSVLVSDDLVRAVEADAPWPLVFPAAHDGGGQWVERAWSGDAAPRPCRVYATIGARALWDRIMRAAYDCAEPGVLFVDRIQRLDNLAYCERLSVTNPCGEIPLPPYGACDLGSLNLTQFVSAPFTPGATLDLAGLRATAAVAVRMLDNVYDITRFPLARQAEVALGSRRIGLGITGLADALIMLGCRYDEPRAADLAAEAMRAICHAAYRASADIAKEKGAFPQFDAVRYTQSEFVRALPDDIVDHVRRHGIRNSHLTAIAPTGSISLLAGNVSSGLEPVYATSLMRRVRIAGGEERTLPVEDYAYALFRRREGDAAALPPAFVAVDDIAPAHQIAMQAALQRHVDNAISKTINVAADCTFEAFRGIYDEAYRQGLKGCAAFRPNPVSGSLLVAQPARCGAAA